MLESQLESILIWIWRVGPPESFAALQALPQELQKRVAAGFELRAPKPS